MIGTLPESLVVDGVEYEIRADYRDVIQMLEMFNDPDLDKADKWIVAVYLLFPCFGSIDEVEEAAFSGEFDINEAAERICWFILAGQEPGKKEELPTYDWTKDEQMIFSAVNKVAGKETRELEYLHWWTFIGYLDEVGEGSFTYIVGIRRKLNKGKKLDKSEREFVRENAEVVKLTPPKTREELAEEAERKAILDEVLG